MFLDTKGCPTSYKIAPNVVSARLLPVYIDVSILVKAVFQLSFHFYPSLLVISKSLALLKEIYLVVLHFSQKDPK